MLIFACWYKFKEIKGWLKNIGLDMVKNGCGNSDLRNLKLAVSQEAIDGINLMFVYWYKFRKPKSFFNNFLVAVVKNRHGLLGLGTLKSAVSQEEVDEMSWYFDRCFPSIVSL